MKTLLPFLILLSVTAFAQSEAIYSGSYFYNFENAAFTPQGSKECWTLRGDMSKAEVKSGAPNGAWGTSDVVLRGTLGPAGHFGNVGSCTHEFAVKEIISATNIKATH